MDLHEKVKRVLRKQLAPERIILRNHEGISGYVVSPQFRRMEPIDRQMLIHKALHEPSAKLNSEELRKVVAIAPLTPEEFVGLGISDEAD